MTHLKTIICLANSIKHHPFRCVAGKEIQGTNSWIRPESSDAKNEGALHPNQSKLQDGSQPKLLDILEISFVNSNSHGCQTENHLINEAVSWRKIGQSNYENIVGLLDAPNTLWTNNLSTRVGLNDSISRDDAIHLPNSLLLIRPANFRIKVTLDGGGQYREKLGIRGSFIWNNVNYRLKITDPNYMENINTYTVDQEYPIDDAIICVSISGLFEQTNTHFKLIAAIITTS